jgi:hypothetical protein
LRFVEFKGDLPNPSALIENKGPWRVSISSIKDLNPRENC